MRLLITQILFMTACAQAAVFPDRTTDPKYTMDEVEVVADLDYPPGNVAVSESGQVFFTYFPLARPPYNLAILENGVARPFPDLNAQKSFSTILSIRIDRQGRLWALDFGNFGLSQPKIFAFDIESKEKVFEMEFPSRAAGFLSMLNDFQVDPEGHFIYVADNSPFFLRQSIIVVDTQSKEVLVRLKDHKSVSAGPYSVRVHGKPMALSGRFGGIDPIALSRDGEYLYYAAFNGHKMNRIKVALLRDSSVSNELLESSVEELFEKTMSDGMTIDNENNLYLSDAEHSAIVQLTHDGRLVTLLKDRRIRWPDGFSFGPEGWLYFTNSAINEILFKGAKTVKEKGPYQIMRFRPGTQGVPGH